MDHATHSTDRPSLDRLAFSATIHCLTGCSIGEVLGMVIGTALGWDNWLTITLSTVLAFVFGYLLTLLPLLSAGMEFRVALALAFASDTLSITIMEIVDNAVIVVIPGAMDAGLTEPLFWVSLIVSLVLAGIAAFPANHWLIAHGRGHALVHKGHGAP
jgi:ABC-type amino acid transport system permease subunit